MFHARYRLNGKRTFHSHDTDVFTVAKLKHAKFMSKVEEDRQSGTVVSHDFRSLGTLAAEFEKRLIASTIEPGTKVRYRYQVKRLQTNWPLVFGTAFATALVRSVGLEHVGNLRDHLKKDYAPAVVNQTLWGLSMLLDIAVEKHTLSVNPFNQRGTLQDAIYLPKKSKKPHLPSRADMERVFAEMNTVPNAENHPQWRVDLLKRRARDVSEHARFLAYSGMRVAEANAFEAKHDHGTLIEIPGTKTEAAARTVPVTVEMRTLLDDLKKRRPSGKLLTVDQSRLAIQRACKRLGLPKLTHHALRHYFITICVESGVDIPTIADWVGHADGGALLIKTYRHLRQEHSIAAAQKVQFRVAS